MHEPVMVTEVLQGLAVRPGGRYVDGTVGDGGHAEKILEAAAPGGRLLAIDRDDEALTQATGRLQRWTDAVDFAAGNFSELAGLAGQHGWSDVDGILFDLGVRSHQIDTAERGFSFMRDGPLDMRMDRTESQTAADLVNSCSEQELALLLFQLGEERFARRIARALVAARAQAPIQTTGELAALVERAVGGRKGKIHPATRTFMALRMAVNKELESITAGLDAALQLVRPGGRVAVITFHSVEDRLVKRFFVEHEGRMESLAAGGEAWRGTMPRVRRVNRKPRVASKEEAQQNPRARSAKLRVIERMHDETT